jgi:hypothetical protein
VSNARPVGEIRTSILDAVEKDGRAAPTAPRPGRCRAGTQSPPLAKRQNASDSHDGNRTNCQRPHMSVVGCNEQITFHAARCGPSVRIDQRPPSSRARFSPTLARPIYQQWIGTADTAWPQPPRQDKSVLAAIEERRELASALPLRDRGGSSPPAGAKENRHPSGRRRLHAKPCRRDRKMWPCARRRDCTVRASNCACASSKLSAELSAGALSIARRLKAGAATSAKRGLRTGQVSRCRSITIGMATSVKYETARRCSGA